jgi:hypothetical protein
VGLYPAQYHLGHGRSHRMEQITGPWCKGVKNSSTLFVKWKFSLSAPGKHKGRAEVKLHLFLAHWIEVWMGPRGGPDISKNKKKICPLSGLEPGAVQPVAQSLYLARWFPYCWNNYLSPICHARRLFLAILLNLKPGTETGLSSSLFFHRTQCNANETCICYKQPQHKRYHADTHHAFTDAFQLIQDTNRQQLGWTLPDTVNTVKCSWWWAKISPETRRADFE